MTRIANALRVAATGLPLALGGCGMFDGGNPAPATASQGGAAAPIAVSGQVGAGTQNGLSGGAEGGATQAGVGVGGVSGLGAGPAAGGGVGGSTAAGNAVAGPGDNSNTPITGTGGGP